MNYSLIDIFQIQNKICFWCTFWFDALISKFHFVIYILCLNKSIRNIIYTLCYQNNKGNDEKKKQNEMKKRHIHINSFETNKERNAKNIVFFYKHTQTHIVFFLHLRCYVFLLESSKKKKRQQFCIFFLSFGNRIDVLLI